MEWWMYDGTEQSGSHCAGSATKSQTENRTVASSHNWVYCNREKDMDWPFPVWLQASVLILIDSFGEGLCLWR